MSTHLGTAANLVPPPQADAVPDGLAQAFVPEVVVEDARGAWVCEDVGIAFMHMIPWEGPMVQRGPCVMVLCTTATVCEFKTSTFVHRAALIFTMPLDKSCHVVIKGSAGYEDVI